MYQALYRKWRPKTFDEVDGQEHITEILKKQVLLGRLSHAYLFTGTRGTGKTTCAKLLARAVNCENPVGGNPCGRCPACVGIENGSILDVTELDAASNNGVENVRLLREEAGFSPVAVKKRVYIIDEVHMLSNSAFNALLKILEEPPEHLIFILATTELHKVPATILSRCQRYSFRRIPPENIIRRLLKVAEAEGIGLTEEAALLLARLADGSFRDALSLLDQCAADVVDRERVLSAIGLAENDEICALMKELLLGDGEAAIARLNALYRSGKEVGSTLNQLAALYRDLLLLKIAPKSGGSLMSGAFADFLLRELGRLADAPRLLAGLNELQEAAQRLARSADRKLAAELCLLKLCASGAGSAAAAEIAAARKPKGETETAARAFEEPGEERAREVPLKAEINTRSQAAGLAGSAADKKSGGSGKVPEWKSVLAALKGRLSDKEFEIICDPQHADVELSQGSIKILALNYYSQGFLSNPQLLAAVKEAASELTGEAVSVKLDLKQ